MIYSRRYPTKEPEPFVEKPKKKRTYKKRKKKVDIDYSADDFIMDKDNEND